MADALRTAYDAFLLDLDGTVYHGARPIPGAAEAIRRLREQGTPVRFVTNNASKAPGDVAAHLRALDVDAAPDEVSTSAQAAAKLLGDRLPAGSAVLVVGAPALEDEITAAGLKPVREAGDDGGDVAAVVQGHNPATGWADLAEACVAIRAGALWVACNVDTTLPTERGLLPGNGSMVAALRTATGATPEVAGKPEAPLFHTAAASANASRPLAVGDRLDTDIAGAVTAGVDSLCVLTGVATPATLVAAAPAERPTYLGADLGALAEPPGELRIAPQPGWQVRPHGDTLVADGDGTPLALLRTLCAVAWDTGVTALRPGGERATAAFTELGLPTGGEPIR
ncbi:HAD-IIA family hydrolase [Amycolatopsis thermophila]|uniref:HAD superfamily hydrolase (TIGR01450 family) n=1 Tax=Amycolatopsis thermophila TaxID=206084 RepID=A0ABU0F3K1_9PSEU|nr:HAD-IIA family hydrolase [Amycolatopsis thermophila]MDQ0382157.1 HAD superfamily hydrolase (TIGR01450 family) [Amycolatopsis thermophila]